MTFLTFSIAIIPNLPFFFCAWRSWHHFKGTVLTSYTDTTECTDDALAYKASSYLEDLIKYGLIKPEANSDMDRIYAEFASSTLIKSKSLHTSEERVLNREAIPKIVALFGLPSSAEKDLLRALDQTKLRLSQGRG